MTLIQSDLFENAGKYLMEQSVDIVVSNPPYICTEVIDSLSEEVRLHDPVLALDGHEDGLYFYRKITKQAKGFLKPGGRLFYEIGYCPMRPGAYQRSPSRLGWIPLNSL